MPSPTPSPSAAAAPTTGGGPTTPAAPASASGDLATLQPYIAQSATAKQMQAIAHRLGMPTVVMDLDGAVGAFERSTDVVQLDSAKLAEDPARATIAYAHEVAHGIDEKLDFRNRAEAKFAQMGLDPDLARIAVEAVGHSVGGRVAAELGVEYKQNLESATTMEQVIDHVIADPGYEESLGFVGERLPQVSRDAITGAVRAIAQEPAFSQLLHPFATSGAPLQLPAA